MRRNQQPMDKILNCHEMGVEKYQPAGVSKEKVSQEQLAVFLEDRDCRLLGRPLWTQWSVFVLLKAIAKCQGEETAKHKGEAFRPTRRLCRGQLRA